ncbi:MAG: hypothetical protein GX857_00100 [Bacteroidales bacterium]|nr:hypothetical protein [Bacteroidales bacterium]
MKKITFRILMVASAILFIAACTNTKNKESADTVYKANGDAVYPSIEGMIPHAVAVDDKGDNEANHKVQLKVGKLMEVDCNLHNLEGEFEEEALEGYGYEYYVFETNGNVASTMMACPDDTKTEKFISGKDHFISYNSKLTTPVYTPEGYEVRFTTWSVDSESRAEQQPNAEINADAAKLLKSFPEVMDNYDRYVIYLPQQDNEEALRLEVIPGIMKEVDCNTHWLMGEFETETVDGMGYDYMVFESDGNVAATRMACPDNEVVEKFVAADGNFGRYNSQLPVVVFAPKGFQLKYKVWTANDTQVADKM